MCRTEGVDEVEVRVMLKMAAILGERSHPKWQIKGEKVKETGQPSGVSEQSNWQNLAYAWMWFLGNMVWSERR